MTHSFSAERLFLFSYFIILILLGAFLLFLPLSWNGLQKLNFIDALFTATSAVCVTGLITVDTTLYSQFGKIVILFLMQTGGLGIISFTTLFLASPNRKISFRSINIIRGYYIDTIEHKTGFIIRNIVVATVGIEIIGAFFIYISIGNTNYLGLGNAIFHSVSAFCNAGFSLYNNNLESFSDNKLLSITIMVLIILGGLGFVVIQDIIQRLRGRRKRFHTHSKMVLLASGFLILSGALGFYLFEFDGSFALLKRGDRIIAALFQSVTSRTAGFNTMSQANLSQPSQILTLPLMFIGGGSGSIAGGVKVTTIFLVMLSVFRKGDENTETRFGSRKISSANLHNANIFVLKAVMILFLSILALSISEESRKVSFMSIIFESFSALGTVGLSLGITPELTAIGKYIIILTMFSGRVGLISLAMDKPKKSIDHHIEYPEGQVLIG